jgi:deoxyadenosine/deoxycytidine kinase
LRGREYEQAIQRDYIEYLNKAYDRWMEKARKEFNVIEINANETDYVNGDADLDELIEKIRQYCP